MDSKVCLLEKNKELDNLVQVIQCFPWYVICEAAHLALFSCRLILLCLKKGGKMSTSHVSIASREKIPKNYNFYVDRIKRRLYSN